MELNDRQREAVEHTGGPLLIIAGAGSGKTKTLTSRLVRLLERGVPPEAILAITFTNKAAKEMKDRLLGSPSLRNRASSIVGEAPFLGTFHSFGYRILKNEAERLGRTPNFSVFDEDDTASIIRRILREHSTHKERLTLSKITAAISRVKNKLLNPEEELDRDMRFVFSSYESLLRASNAFDFNDLIEKVVVLFRSNPKILEKYQNAFSHILVDEYQDVNPAQYELVRTLAARHGNVSVVGDDAQAIYGWRHANYKNFLNFDRDWPRAKVVALEENYRSTGTIVAAASALIQKNVGQRPKRLWTKNESGTPIRVVAAGGPEEEGAWIASEIQTLTRGVPHTKEKGLESFKAKKFEHPAAAILYRTNAQSRAIEQALIERNVPYRIFGGIRFYDRQEIKDIVAGIRIASNPKDEASAERLMKNLPKRIAAPAIQELRSIGAEKSIPEIIAAFLAATGYLERLDQKFENASERRENIEELISFAAEFPTAADFLERVSLLQSTDAPREEQPNPSAVLMSIHMAKGLEFDTVFIAGASEGLLPHQMSYGSTDSFEEERRLMYVAMTRARKSLAITFSKIPSQFLYEIPPELTNFINLRGGRSLYEGDDDIIYVDE
jgi:DNA helicase-2/ATP-dependent DNA helicase PcrA